MNEWIEGLSIFLRGIHEEKIRCSLHFFLFINEKWFWINLVKQQMPSLCMILTAMDTFLERRCFKCGRRASLK